MSKKTASPKVSNVLVAENGAPLEIPKTHEEDAKEWALNAAYDVYYRYQNEDHFKYATNQSSEAIDTREVRHAIAKLVRYEFRNNPTFKAFIEKLIHSVIRTGPTLDVTPDNSTEKSERAAKDFERNWGEYAEEIRLTRKLEMFLRERKLAGEGFGVFERNPRNSYGIDLVPYEMEQFQDPHSEALGIRYGARFESAYPPADGIFYDRFGNPELYHRLKYHPGGTSTGAWVGTYSTVQIRSHRVVHWFKRERPTTRRGMSEGADCIETLAKLRRLDESVLNTLEKESKILASMETNLPIGQCTTINSPRMSWDWAGAQVTSTPQGWRMTPWNTGSGRVQSYREVKDELKREIAARFLLPWNVATSSEDFNFASARIDTIIWNQVIEIIRDEIESEILTPFYKWWLEFAFYKGVIPADLGAFKFRWFWPEKEALDQVKQANADKIYNGFGQFDEIEHWKNKGRNASDVFEERVKLAKQKREILARHGMTVEEVEQTEEERAKSAVS